MAKDAVDEAARALDSGCAPSLHRRRAAARRRGLPRRVERARRAPPPASGLHVARIEHLLPPLRRR